MYEYSIGICYYEQNIYSSFNPQDFNFYRSTAPISEVIRNIFISNIDQLNETEVYNSGFELIGFRQVNLL